MLNCSILFSIYRHRITCRDDLVLQIELDNMHWIAILQLSLFYDDFMD